MEPIVREALLKLSQQTTRMLRNRFPQRVEKQAVMPNMFLRIPTPEHATDQGKRGAIVVLSEYRQERRHKFVADEKRQAVQPAVII
jgi:hypothetical protein